MIPGSCRTQTLERKKFMSLRFRICILLTVILVLGSHQFAAAEEKKLPNIVILATGGTIAGAAATGTQAGYTSGAVTIDSMLAAVPGIKDLPVACRQLFQDSGVDICLGCGQSVYPCETLRLTEAALKVSDRHIVCVGALPLALRRDSRSGRNADGEHIR